MIKTTSCLSAAALLAFGLPTAPAQAASSRTFVSAAIGNDANDCSRPTPCRTFQGAHDKTSPDGEVTVLDPGGYGAVTITKSISIVNDGMGEASILVSGGATGITVNAGPASYVNLRGITIQGIGFGGGTGLLFISGFALTITNCVIRNHTGNGIWFVGNRNLSVSNTLVADNGGHGISITPQGAGVLARVALSRVELYNNSHHGLNVDGALSTGTLYVAMADSVTANNGESGILAHSSGAQAVTSAMMMRSLSFNNGVGISTSGTVTARIGQSTLMGNSFSWQMGINTTLRSYGDNNIDGNEDANPAIPNVIAKK